MAAELAQELSEIPETSKAYLIGGQPRVVRVEPDPDRMAAAGVSWIALSGALRSAAAKQDAGTMVRDNRETRIEAGPLFESPEDVARVVVGVRAGRPVYAADVARVIDGPGETTDAVFFAVGPGPRHRRAARRPRVPRRDHRPGEAAGRQCHPPRRGRARRRSRTLRPRLLPASVHLEVTRNYGQTAEDKSNELVQHLLIATLSVVALISLAMGWRSGLVVGIAVPVTLALTLFIYFLAGYTLNRVTLFALIFSIGILVDDAIVVVENIERHHREKPGAALPARRRRGRGRGRQPHDPRDLHRHRGDPPHGLRPRADGPLHAADPDGGLGRDAVLAGRGLHRFALGRLPDLPTPRGRRQATRRPRDGRRASIAGP